MVLRHYMLENLRWKIAALLLAMVAWLSIQFAIWKGFGDWRAQTLQHQTVQVVTTPGDPRTFRIEPAEVDVVLKATPGAAKNLSDYRVTVFVNLTDIPDVTGVIREVLVYSPGQTQVIRTEPKAVYVERIDPDSLTNSVTKP